MCTLSGMRLLGAVLVFLVGCGSSQPIDDGSIDAGGDVAMATDAGPDAAACGAGLYACPSGCVSLFTDPANCGACGVACAAGQTCAGSCVGGDAGAEADVTVVDAARDAGADVAVDVGPPDVGPSCVDADSDGWGVGAGCMPAPADWSHLCSHETPCAGDCNDSDPLTYPHASEFCDGIDENCDGFADVIGDPSTAAMVASCTHAEPTTITAATIVACGFPGDGYALPQRCVGSYFDGTRWIDECWTDPERTTAMSGSVVPCR